jgi:hypothetical protein
MVTVRCMWAAKRVMAAKVSNKRGGVKRVKALAVFAESNSHL